MRGWTAVEAGVYESATGRAKIRIRPTAGAKRIELELPNVEIAREVYAEGVRLRDVQGLDLRDVWEDRLREAAIDKRLKGDGKDLSTVGSTFDAFFAQRGRLVQASDSAVSGLDRGSGTLRPTSFAAERTEYATYIARRLGPVPLVVLDTAAVRDWVTRLATDASKSGQGYAYGTQLGALGLLRQAIRETVPERRWPPGFPWNEVKPITPGRAGDAPPEPGHVARHEGIDAAAVDLRASGSPRWRCPIVLSHRHLLGSDRQRPQRRDLRDPVARHRRPRPRTVVVPDSATRRTHRRSLRVAQVRHVRTGARPP